MTTMLHNVKVNTEYTRFRGGIDLESPAIIMDPGKLLAANNYVPGVEGGYERIDGYERFDGRTSPSSASYYYCPCTFTAGGPAVGNTITGADSGETAVVIVVGDDYICVTKLSGSLTANEVFKVGGVAKGTFTAAQVENGQTTSQLHAAALNLTADVYRADIAAPTGSGAVRGLAILNGVLYCFIDNAAGTFGAIYKQSTSGWTAVALLHEISFGAGTGEISDGNAITQLVSGATAVASRVVLESGTWAGGDAAGRLILSTITGTFDATNDIQVGGVTKATSTSLATAITIAAGGRYEFDVFNFTGSTDTRRIYGCDGVNRGFEFDGTVYVPINTGMTVDKPLHVKCYKQQLFFSFRGSSQNSGVGTPYQWEPVVGASEIGLGDNITGYLVVAETLLINARNSCFQLQGDGVDTFFLDPIDNTMGAIPYTMQALGNAYALDDQGIVDTVRTDQYGNFNSGAISRKIQSLIDNMRTVVVASSVYKHKNQYRLYGSDGTGICMTLVVGRDGIEYHFCPFLYPDKVACVVTGEDSTGKDVIFFGSDQGMVYQADKGSSFDGEDIEAFMFTAFNNSRSPTIRKTYRRAIIEMDSSGYTEVRLSAMFSYGDSDIQTHINETVPIQGLGGFWNLVGWDEFYYDSDVVASPSLSISGSGRNISIILYSKSDEDLGHRFDGVIIHHTKRRLVR